MKKKIILTVVLLLVTLVLLLGAAAAFWYFVLGNQGYTVTFDTDGGTLDTADTVTVTEQSTVSLPLPYKEGYTFIGWYVGYGANETKFKATDLVTSDITLKAKWINDDYISNSGVKLDVHSVTFDANGGTLSGETEINAQTYSMINLPTPTKEHHVFLGWFVGEAANQTQFTATSLVTCDLTLTAKWEKAEYTVTFLDFYGDVIARNTVKYGEAAIAPTVPRVAEERLRFDRWDTDVSVITADIEVTALYVTDAYTITYVTNSSQTIPPSAYFFDVTPLAPRSPSLSEHYFIGWYLDEEFTEQYLFDAPLTKDITLYAYFNEAIPITTLEELLAIPEYSSNNYFIKNDIDCEGAVITTSIVGFAGTLNGEGHKIHNFVLQPTQANNVGLFSVNSGTIKNLTLDNFSYALESTNIGCNVGVLAGTNNGKIENVHLTNATVSYVAKTDNSGTYNASFGALAGLNGGEVSGCSVTSTNFHFESWTRSSYNSSTTMLLYASALVGTNNASIKDSAINTAVTLYINAGTYNGTYSFNTTKLGFGGVASVNNGNILDCDSKINLEASSNNYRTNETYIGGFVFNNKSEIERCSADVTAVFSSKFSYLTACGFVENNGGTVKDSYANVDISDNGATANSGFGGFANYNHGGIYRCYATGDMSVATATVGKGGFAQNNAGSINSCFASVNITATDSTNYGPFVGYQDTASYVTNCHYSNVSSFLVNDVPMVFDNTVAEATSALNLSDAEYLTGTLGWSDEIWAFDEYKIDLPTLK